MSDGRERDFRPRKRRGSSKHFDAHDEPQPTCHPTAACTFCVSTLQGECEATQREQTEVCRGRRHAMVKFVKIVNKEHIMFVPYIVDILNACVS